MILVLLIVIPVAAGLLAWFSGRFHAKAPFWISFIGLLADQVIGISIWSASPASIRPDATGNRWIMEFNSEWIPQFGISIHLGLDGLSLVLVLLTAFIGLMAVISSWSEIRERTGFFYANLMFIEAGILGVFLSLDLFLFYFCWELMLVPMYFLISIWGHENRAYASVKFFIFTQASGLLMFVSILGLYFAHGQATGIYTFDYTQLLGTRLSTIASLWLMAGFAIAFAVKLPVVPFHTWLADAHTEAPTAGSIILAGLMLKTGAYGFLRFVLPLFPDAASMLAYPAMIAGTVSVLYGASLAFAQTDLKRLVAYTSISHMGFVLIGIFAFNMIALQGAMIQMVSHAISTGMLFFIVGALQERIHTRDIRLMGGMWSTAPRMGAAALIFAMASLGLPGMGNFIGEFLVLLGAFAADITITVIATAGLIAATVYSVWFMHVTFFSKAVTVLKFSDFTIREMLVTTVMVLAIIWIGMFPQPLLDMSRDSVQRVRQLMQAGSNKAVQLPINNAVSKGVDNERP
jgi:NADH-quinone oxidoreductase subunit M